MALKDLKSNLSWYGKVPPGSLPSEILETKFNIKNNVPGTAITGYSDNGDRVLFRQASANDSFTIDHSMTDRGLASRDAQQGNGTLFPIGPEGQTHEFDIARTGFSSKNKYSETYGVNVKEGNSGLADTYTIDSPIDDMYNKFNIRDDAHNKFNIKQPFIVRGIQRDDNSDPQRWGNEVSFNIPRGGVTTMATRVAADLERIGKFLITGKGISFIAKQAGLQLTNPNVEGVSGYPGLLSMGKIYDPLSPLTNAAGAPFGLRTDRNMPPIVRAAIGTYEGVHNARVGDLAVSANRLNKLRIEAFTNQQVSEAGALESIDSFFSNVSNFTQGLASDNRSDRRFPGEVYVALTGLTGPGSILGVGNTTIRRYTVSVGDHTRLDALSRKRNNIINTGKHPYFTHADNRPSTNDFLNFRKGAPYDKDKGEIVALLNQSNFNGGTGNVGDRPQNLGAPSSDSQVGVQKEYDIMSYDLLQKAASERANGAPNLDYDFIQGRSFTMEKGVVKDGDSIPLINDGEDYRFGCDDRGERTGGGYEKSPNGGQQEGVAAYTRMAYGDIPKESFAGKTQFNDFRETAKSYTEGISIGFSDPKIDDIDKDDFGESDNLVPFKFKFPDGKGEDVWFKANLGSINDSFAPGWNGQADQGRADSRYLYESFERTINVDFMVAVHAGDKLQKTYDQLQKLADGMYPVYAGKGFHGQYCEFTLGNLYKDLKVICTDLSFDWDNETPWEVTGDSRVPWYCNVSVGMTVLDDKPESGIKIYDIASEGEKKEKPKSEGTSGTGGGSGDQKESSAKKKKNNRSKNNSKSGNSGGSGDSGGKPEQSWEGRQYDKIFGTGENATKIKNVLSDVKQQAKNTYNKAATKVKDAWNWLTSDRRAKTDIVYLKKSHNGIPLYMFRYKDEIYGKGTYVGCMAQDLIEMGKGDCVIKDEVTGLYRVNYQKLGIEMYKIESISEIKDSSEITTEA